MKHQSRFHQISLYRIIIFIKLLHHFTRSLNKNWSNKIRTWIIIWKEHLWHQIWSCKKHNFTWHEYIIHNFKQNLFVLWTYKLWSHSLYSPTITCKLTSIHQKQILLCTLTGNTQLQIRKCWVTIKSSFYPSFLIKILSIPLNKQHQIYNIENTQRVSSPFGNNNIPPSKVPISNVKFKRVSKVYHVF